MTSRENKRGLNGLVLAGGKSSRMGLDKGKINWHGKEQRYYIADLLQSVCDDVFISCREEQANEIDSAYKVLADAIPVAGPYGAILSALSSQKGSAWLVVACDLPLLDVATLEYLLAQRDEHSIATTFESPHDGLPEPLITIWEETSYPVLNSLFSEGLTCPRKALLKNIDKVKLIQPVNPDTLINANTPEDAQRVTDMLNLKNAPTDAAGV